MLEVALAAAATLVALAATLATFDRWLVRRRSHEVTWAAAFALFTVASATLALGAGAGWNGTLFRTFYLFGAILNVPILALGTVLLLASERTRRGATWVVLGFCLFSAGVMVATPFTAAIPADRLARGSEVLPELPRILAASASSLATLVVVGGAVRSALRFRNPQFAKSEFGGRRALGNVLIAVGVLLTGASGLANSVLGDMGAFALFLAIGVSVIFTGYLVITSGGGGSAVSLPDGSNKSGARTPERSSGRGG
jgi:hypothetical protein